MKFMINYEVKKEVKKEVNAELIPLAVDGGILLRINGWNVFRIFPNGTGRLIQWVGESSGLQIDEEGRIKLVN